MYSNSQFYKNFILWLNEIKYENGLLIEYNAKTRFLLFQLFFIFWFRKANCFRPFFWRFHLFFLVNHVWMQACGQNPFPLRTNFKQLTPSFLLLMFAVFYYKRNIFKTILGSNSKEKERGTCPRVHLCTCISKLLCLFCAC